MFEHTTILLCRICYKEQELKMSEGLTEGVNNLDEESSDAQPWRDRDTQGIMLSPVVGLQDVDVKFSLHHHRAAVHHLRRVHSSYTKQILHPFKNLLCQLP